MNVLTIKLGADKTDLSPTRSSLSHAKKQTLGAQRTQDHKDKRN